MNTLQFNPALTQNNEAFGITKKKWLQRASQRAGGIYPAPKYTDKRMFDMQDLKTAFVRPRNEQAQNRENKRLQAERTAQLAKLKAELPTIQREQDRLAGQIESANTIIQQYNQATQDRDSANEGIESWSWRHKSISDFTSITPSAYESAKNDIATLPGKYLALDAKVKAVESHLAKK